MNVQMAKWPTVILMQNARTPMAPINVTVKQALRVMDLAAQVRYTYC